MSATITERVPKAWAAHSETHTDTRVVKTQLHAERSAGRNSESEVRVEEAVTVHTMEAGVDRAMQATKKVEVRQSSIWGAGKGLFLLEDANPGDASRAL